MLDGASCNCFSLGSNTKQLEAMAGGDKVQKRSVPNLARREAMEPPGTYSRKIFSVSSDFSVPCAELQASSAVCTCLSQASMVQLHLLLCDGA